MALRLLIKTRVVAVHDEAAGIRSFTVAPVHRADLPPYRGGAHTIVRLPDGERRSYSLCGDPLDRTRYRIAVLREVGGRGGSAYLHDHVGTGDTLWVMHPQESFALAPDANRHVFVAGGIGITPLLAMLRDLPPDADAELHYCVRTEAHAAFLDELADTPAKVRLYRGDHGERLDVDILSSIPPPGTHLYCCGPQRLLDAALDAAVEWPDGSVHVERFTAATDPAARRGDPFTVELVASGRMLEVPPDRTLLQALHSDGVTVDASCEGGICRSCKVQLLDGDVTHRDRCLSPGERAEFLAACVSRGNGPLRLLL